MAVHCRQASRAAVWLIAVLVLVCAPDRTSAGQRDGQKSEDDKKPSLALKATPPLGFSPLRVRVGVDVRGGPDDYVEFYCPSIEWDWGDGTVSENSEDCEPYEAGASTIRRRFAADHVYREAGSYRVMFRLKQKSKSIAVASANIQVRAGIREDVGR